MRLDGYVRVSRVAGREGESFISPDVQRERIEAYTKAHDHSVVAWHEDLDQPGGKWERPEFQKALERVSQRETEGIIVASFDRFARSITDAFKALEEIEGAGGQLVSVKEQIDPTTPFGRFGRTVMLALAELERERIRENWEAAKERAIGRGVHIASRTPTGYKRRDDRRLEPDPLSAPVIRDAFRRRAAGASWRDLCDLLDTKGVVGPYGNGHWTTAAVSKIIRNRVYLGEARAGRHVNAQAHKAIVTPAEWEAAQGVNGVTARGEGLLLSGLVRCAGCRYLVKPDRMKGRGGERIGFYRCRKHHPGGLCPSPVDILARVIEPHVEAEFLAALGPQGVLYEAVRETQEIDTALRTLEEAERELAAYRDETRIADLIGKDAFLAGLKERARQVDRARENLGEARRRSQLASILPTVPTDLTEAWPELSIQERRAILSAAIDCIFVFPARGQGRAVPASERVRILWRGEGPDDLPRRGRRVALRAFEGSAL